MMNLNEHDQDERLAQRVAAGNACAKESDWGGAARAFLDAIEVDEDSAAAYNNLGYVLQLNSHGDEAIFMYLRALALDPDFEIARNNLLDAVLRRVDAARQLGDAKDARRWIALGLAALGPSRELLLARGDACLEDGRLSEAMASYTAVLQSDRGDTDAWSRLGNACEVAGDAQRASGAYLTAVQSQPQEASECTDEGIQAMRAGHYDLAVQWFRRALGRDPGYEPAVPYLEWAQTARENQREAAMAA